MAFVAPQGNKTVMVDNNNNIVYPASFQKVVATQATIAGNNFTDVPSVIDPENATTTQLPSVASVVNYVADVVEGGSSGLIPAIQSDIQTLGQVKSNRGEFWFKGGFATISNMSMNGSWSLCCRIRMQASQVQYASIFHFGAFYLYWNTRLAVYCSPTISSVTPISVDDNNRLANGEWHSLVVSYDGTTLKLTDETGVLLSIATSSQISISDRLLIGESKYNGQMADIKYFNFDMSDVNAPYTIDDYISGKDESPLLQTTQPIIDWHNLSGNTQSTTQTKGQSGTLELNRTAASYPRIFENGTFKVGYTYYIRLSGKVLFPSGDTGVSLRLRLPTSTAEITNNLTGEVVVSTPSNSQYAFGQGDGVEFDRTIKFIPTETNNDENCLLYFNPIATGSNSYVNVSVRCDNALFSLDDYSIKVGATQIVPDVSSYNNDATITGAVYGSKDKSIAKMAQLFYQSQQG